MNPIQKAYEYIDKTTIMLKRSQSLYHLRNLTQIREKKTQIKLFNPSKAEHMKPTEFNKFETRKIDKDNEILRQKLVNLFKRNPKPLLNLDFIENTKKKLKISKNKRKEMKKMIGKENNDIYKRLGNLKPFFNAKTNDRSYDKEHLELINRIRKFPNGIIPKLTLPQVQIRIRKNSSYSNIKFSSNKNSKNLNECSNEKNKDSNKENEGDLFFSTAIKV